MIDKLDIYAKAEIGKSLAGFQIGSKLELYLPYIHKTIDGKKLGWNINIPVNNEGILLYEWPELYGSGYSIFIKKPKIELIFTDKGNLCHIIVGQGYKGEIFDGVKIGDKLADIKHDLVVDNTEPLHYLSDGQGGIIGGIYYAAGGLELADDPDAIIETVCVYDDGLD